ncbi:hypothetical protein [Nonomuraea sp. NPDC048916]|uniref:hypothetical protein n=1 Tax=Nonomuraea sp. NPDC048916 TaxID=3154232 RepID=UPI0033DF3FDD
MASRTDTVTICAAPASPARSITAWWARTKPGRNLKFRLATLAEALRDAADGAPDDWSGLRDFVVWAGDPGRGALATAATPADRGECATGPAAIRRPA